MISKLYINKLSSIRNLLKAVATLVFLLPGVLLYSQESTPKSAVFPTFGFGVGFFYPKGVNDYIKEMNSQYSETFNTQIYMYFEIKGGLTFRMKKFDVSAVLEYDMAPKIVTVSNGDSKSYSFNRLSPEISANYYFPNKTGKNAFFLGAGVNYSFLKFQDFKGESPGFKLQAGYSLQFGKTNLQPYVAFRSVSADDKVNGLNLNYTGGQIGIIISSHKRISYK